ncbi:MAG: GFA family protein [Gammaproteobacteria bacterium]|nr:GFA family protein [Gammaproteobacteria bacterium]
MSDVRYGGCQCGAIRYRAMSLRDNSHVCHCRMCQKAMGNFFAALVGVPLQDFAWTRGEAAVFRSSAHVERGFCSACGTPLFFRQDDGTHISMTIGSFDHPETIPLTYQYGMERKLPQVAQLADLPNNATTEEDDPEEAAAIKRSNRQHPDHETDQWPI